MTSEPIRFFVEGRPSPGGSKRGFQHKHTGKIVLVDMGGKKTKLWRQRVASEARKAFAEPLKGPLAFTFTFVLERPRCHYRTGKYHDQLRPSAPEYPIVAPDATKLTRSTEDALALIAWRDDAQVVAQQVFKQYGKTPGCHIEIVPYEGRQAG